MQNTVPTTKRRHSEFLCHAAFWYGILFATPMLIAISNRQDLPVDLPLLGAGLFVFFMAISLASLTLARLLPDRGSQYLASTLVAISLVLAVQGNLLHPLADFGRFDGSIVNFRKFGGYFWLEWIAFLASLGYLSWAFARLRELPHWLAWIPILSFTLLWLPAVLDLDRQFHASDGHDESGPSAA